MSELVRGRVALLSPPRLRWAGGQAGRPLLALGVEAPGGGSCMDGVCLEHR